MSFGSAELIQQREQHYTRFFGPLTRPIMHSTDAKAVHVDIYTFEPTKERPFFTLITGGMSDMPQNIPSEYDIAPRAEIMLYAQEPKGWTYNVIKDLAEMPSDDDTFLSYRHTVPNGQPMTADPSLLSSYFFMFSLLEPNHFSPMLVDGDATDILLTIPITEAERRLAAESGSDALIDLFQKHSLDPIIHEDRPCLPTNQRA